MLLTWMYHRISNTANDDISRFSNHLETLAKQYSIVVPREPLKRGLNLCLTFDDAYADFYHHIFPLLLKLNIQAVLAVPAGMIIEHADLNMTERLNIPMSAAMSPENLNQGSLCTWDELREMQESGYVHIASHGMGHVSMKDPACDLEKELLASKALLEEKLNTDIDTLIYPYGHFTSETHAVAQAHYDTIFRVGYAMNLNWCQPGQVLHRINADPYWQAGTFPTAWERIQFLMKAASSRLRGR